MAAPDTAFVQQYMNNITMLAQQMTSTLRRAVMVDTDFKSEKKFYDQYASDSMVELSTRYQDTPLQLPDHRRRVVTPRFFVSATLEDPIDAKQMLIDPKSTYMQAKQAAAGRQIDDIIVVAMFADASTGKTGTGTAAFTTGNIVAVNEGGGGSDVGLNKAKVLKAKRLLDVGEVEDEDRFFGHTAVQLEDLLNITEVASGDFNIVKALVEGTVSRWVGFDWIRNQRFVTDTNSDRRCYAWHKKAMQLAISQEPEGRIDERVDKNMAWQVYLRLCFGVTRLEEARIVQVLCDET